VSEPLTGDCRATNNNAEIQAVTLAINIAKIAGKFPPDISSIIVIVDTNYHLFVGIKKLNVHIDSINTIKCINDWMPCWLGNGWKTANGTPVANKAQLQILMKAKEGIELKWVLKCIFLRFLS